MDRPASSHQSTGYCQLGVAGVSWDGLRLTSGFISQGGTGSADQTPGNASPHELRSLVSPEPCRGEHIAEPPSAASVDDFSIEIPSIGQDHFSNGAPIAIWAFHSDTHILVECETRDKLFGPIAEGWPFSGASMP